MIVRLRRERISVNDIGMSYAVYNGKKYIKVTVKEGMEGCFFGQFCPTRAYGLKLHKKKDIKKKNDKISWEEYQIL